MDSLEAQAIVDKLIIQFTPDPEAKTEPDDAATLLQLKEQDPLVLRLLSLHAAQTADVRLCALLSYSQLMETSAETHLAIHMPPSKLKEIENYVEKLQQSHFTKSNRERIVAAITSLKKLIPETMPLAEVKSSDNMSGKIAQEIISQLEKLATMTEAEVVKFANNLQARIDANDEIAASTSQQLFATALDQAQQALIYTRPLNTICPISQGAIPEAHRIAMSNRSQYDIHYLVGLIQSKGEFVSAFPGCFFLTAKDKMRIVEFISKLNSDQGNELRTLLESGPQRGLSYQVDHLSMQAIASTQESNMSGIAINSAMVNYRHNGVAAFMQRHRDFFTTTFLAGLSITSVGLPEEVSEFSLTLTSLMNFSTIFLLFGRTNQATFNSIGLGTQIVNGLLRSVDYSSNYAQDELHNGEEESKVETIGSFMVRSFPPSGDLILTSSAMMSTASLIANRLRNSESVQRVEAIASPIVSAGTTMGVALIERITSACTDVLSAARRGRIYLSTGSLFAQRRTPPADQPLFVADEVLNTDALYYGNNR